MRIGWDIGLGDLVEQEFAGPRCVLRAAAEVTGGDAGVADRVDRVIGVELRARAAVGIHVGEDADSGGLAGVDEDDAVFIGGHGDRADLIDAEGYVEVLVVDGFVGLGVDDADAEWVGWLGKSRYWLQEAGSENCTQDRALFLYAGMSDRSG